MFALWMYVWLGVGMYWKCGDIGRCTYTVYRSVYVCGMVVSGEMEWEMHSGGEWFIV